MNIDFRNKKTREMCEQQAIATRKLGAACARKLRSRLADLMAAERVTDLVAGRPHPLERERTGQFAVDLEGGRRLVFEPDHQPAPTQDDGSVDWSRITKVRIVYIGDYHD